MAINEKRSYTEVNVTQPTSDFDIGFKFYENRDGINSTVNGVPASAAGYTTQLINSNTIRFTPSVLAGAVVRIMRETDIDKNVYQFSSGALWTAEQMDENFEQIRHSQQESRDIAIETRRQFDRLDTQVQTVVGGLNEALTVAEQAAFAAEAAAAAADSAARAAEEAAQLTRSAENVIDSSGKTQQWFNDKLKRENVSAWDFFTLQELQGYIASPNTFDCYRPLQAFLDYVRDNDVGTGYFSGSWYISQGLVVGGSGRSATRLIVGAPYLYALGPIDIMMKDQAGQNFEWLGFIRLTGHRTTTAGTYTYANRTCRVGFSSPDVVTSRQKFTGFHFQHFYQTGLDARYQTTLTGYGRIRANGCGTGSPTESYCLTANWSNKVDSGSSGSTGQLSVITVDTLPNTAIDTTMFALIGTSYHAITAIDRTTNQLTVYPWVDTTLTSGKLIYVFGGAVDISGSDSSADYLDMIDATNCGMALFCRALYCPNVTVVCSQYNGVAVAIGANRSAANRGGNINSLYTENNRLDLLSVTLDGANSININSHYAFSPKKFYAISPRSSSNAFSYLGNAKGISLRHNGNWFEYQGNPLNTTGSNNTVDIFSRCNYSRTFLGSTGTFNFAPIDKDLNRMFGIDTGYVTVSNSTGDGTPTRVTFKAPTDGSFTINGGTSDVVFENFRGAAEFMITARIEANDYVIRHINSPSSTLKASVTYDPASLAPNEIQYWNVTLTGVKLGDMVACSFSRALNGTRMWAECTGANIVTVYHQNPTAAAVDIASGTLNVKVI